MQARYRTVTSYGECEIEINKSRFIAYVERVESEAAAQAFIEQISKKHWNATHNCSAYVVGPNDQYQKANDDGEPSGTAGKPILECLKKNGLRDTVVVVTRYFGGIKLGAGGLIRAYGKSAASGLAAAGVVERVLHNRLTVEIDYSQLGAVENQLRLAGYTIADKQFTHVITLVVLVTGEAEAVLRQNLSDWTAGTACVREAGQEYVELVPGDLLKE